jgi:hypothetical protein
VGKNFKCQGQIVFAYSFVANSSCTSLPLNIGYKEYFLKDSVTILAAEELLHL